MELLLEALSEWKFKPDIKETNKNTDRQIQQRSTIYLQPVLALFLRILIFSRKREKRDQSFL